MTFNRLETVCFTGHRYAPRSVYAYTCATVDRLVRVGKTVYLAGGALGFDTIAARAVLAARDKYPFVRLVLALPCPQQDALWSHADREEYRAILSAADEAVLIAPMYSAACMHLRNRFMVDNSSLCVAYYNGSSGGTASTVAYARERRVQVLNLCADTADAPQLSLTDDPELPL